MNAAARRTYRESFREGHDCPRCGSTQLPVGLADAERERRATALYKGHMTRLALASVKKRSRKAATAGVRLPTVTSAAEPRDERSAA